MDKFLIKQSGNASISKKRKLSMMSECEFEEVDAMVTSKKKRKLNDDDSDFVVSDDGSDGGHSDLENNNNANSNQNDKDHEIQRLKKELKIMTEKYKKMKADNIR